MSIQSSTSEVPAIDPIQAKAEKAQRKAERAARRLAKAEKSEKKASSSSTTTTTTPPTTIPSTSTSTSNTTIMPAAETSSTTSKKEKKRKASSSDPVADPTTTTTDPTDPPAPKRQKSKKLKSAAKQLETPKDPLVPAASSSSSSSPTSTTANGKSEGVDVNMAKVGEDDEVVPLTPEEDSKLDDQAKKALIYAQTYARNKQHPTVVWKFNKAKQNWLLRNVWSAELIPGRWVGLAIDYLKTMQGIALKNLVAEAKKHLATPIITQLSTDDAPPTESAETPATAPSSEPIPETTDDAESKSEPEIVVEDARTKEVKDRARRILTAVGMDSWSV